MMSNQWKEWLHQPEKLDRSTLYELRNLLARYPYFQLIRLLYLKNLYLLRDESFGDELRKSVLYIAHRRLLFEFIESARYQVLGSESLKGFVYREEIADLSVDRTMALIEAFLERTPTDWAAQGELDYASDYTAFLLTSEENEPAPESKSAWPLQQEKLIDRFIQQDEASSLEPQAETSKVEEPTSHPQPALDGTTELELATAESGTEGEQDYFTETLAKIYIQQKRYAKALEIIKKLSLKYPKKNAFFADQIRFLEKLIINTNSKE